MKLPANSPYLNLIENVCGIISRMIYANVRQFSSLAELTVCVFKEWDNLDSKYLKQLVESIPERMAESLAKIGGSTIINF